MIEWNGRRVLIAGATGGVGASVASTAAEAGAHVLLLGRRRVELESLASRIETHGGRATAAVADAVDAAQVQSAIAELGDAAGGVDALVNTVGINIRSRRLDQLDEQAWRTVIDVNLTAAFVLTRAVLPIFQQQQDGHIVHIASTAARTADLSGAAYQASKAGLGALARATMLESSGDGVRVSTVYPGLIATDFVRHRPQPPAPGELDRALQPSDVAAVCMTILSMPPRAVVSEVVMAPARQ